MAVGHGGQPLSYVWEELGIIIRCMMSRYCSLFHFFLWIIFTNLILNKLHSFGHILLITDLELFDITFSIYPWICRTILIWSIGKNWASERFLQWISTSCYEIARHQMHIPLILSQRSFDQCTQMAKILLIINKRFKWLFEVWIISRIVNWILFC